MVYYTARANWYNLHEKNLEMLLADTKEDLNKWKDVSCSWIGRLKVREMSFSPKLFYNLNKLQMKYK